MGCGPSKKREPNVIATVPVNAVAASAGAVNQNRTALAPTRPKLHPEVVSGGSVDYRTDNSGELSPAGLFHRRQRSTEPGTFPSSRFAESFNVICWCNDALTLEAMEEHPFLEYTSERTVQTITFNRISALNLAALDVGTQVTAVVYLINNPEDVLLIRDVYDRCSHIWNHFIMASEVCEEIQVPVDLPIPVLRQGHNLPKEIHESFLDQLVVIEAFLTHNKGNSAFEKVDMTDVLSKREIITHPDIVELRKFWMVNRMRLWTMKEDISKHLSNFSSHVGKLLAALQVCIASSVELTEGNFHFTFGDMTMATQSLINVHLGTNSIMEHIALPTASIIRYTDKDCWICLSLMPNPERTSVIDNSVLAHLAKNTYEKIIEKEPALADLFGLVQGKLYLCFWLSITHKSIQGNKLINEFLLSVKELDQDQEVKGSYKSVFSAADLLRSGENLWAILLEQAVITIKWSLTAPVWLHWTKRCSVLEKICEFMSLACAYADVDMSFHNASEIPPEFFPQSWSLGSLLTDFISKIREPLESSPNLMKQLNTSLEFYEPKVKLVGRVRNLGMELSCEIPDLSCLLMHRKTYPFLCDDLIHVSGK